MDRAREPREPDTLSLEGRIQQYLRGAASRFRETERIGPFLATFTPDSENPYINYALPDDGSMPTLEEVAGLVAAYERHGRKPRLEYLAPLAPQVEPALLAAGFEVETRAPLLVCAKGALQELSATPEIELVTPRTPEEIRDAVVAQHEAYEQDAPQPSDVERLRKNLEAGAGAVLARVAATGEPAGAGVYTVPEDGVTEVAGIGVRPAFRRRGIAGALTVRLTEEALSAGVTLPFLMAAGLDEARIYAKAGYRRIGDVLHISKPG